MTQVDGPEARRLAVGSIKATIRAAVRGPGRPDVKIEESEDRVDRCLFRLDVAGKRKRLLVFRDTLNDHGNALVARKEGRLDSDHRRQMQDLQRFVTEAVLGLMNTDAVVARIVRRGMEWAVDFELELE